MFSRVRSRFEIISKELTVSGLVTVMVKGDGGVDKELLTSAREWQKDYVNYF